jgi:hypothetical protein
MRCAAGCGVRTEIERMANLGKRQVLPQFEVHDGSLLSRQRGHGCGDCFPEC